MSECSAFPVRDLARGDCAIVRACNSIRNRFPFLRRILFEECASLLTAAREKLHPRVATRPTDSLNHPQHLGPKKRRSSASLFSEAGANMKLRDRELLAQAIDGCIWAVQFPVDSRKQFKSLGIPLTPRMMGTLAVAVVSTLATAIFRLVSG